MLTTVWQSVSDMNAVMMDAQLITVCLMITACTHSVISGFDLCAETVEQSFSFNSCVVSGEVDCELSYVLTVTCVYVYL